MNIKLKIGTLPEVVHAVCLRALDGKRDRFTLVAEEIEAHLLITQEYEEAIRFVAQDGRYAIFIPEIGTHHLFKRMPVGCYKLEWKGVTAMIKPLASLLSTLLVTAPMWTRRVTAYVPSSSAK